VREWFEIEVADTKHGRCGKKRKNVEKHHRRGKSCGWGPQFKTMCNGIIY